MDWSSLALQLRMTQRVERVGPHRPQQSDQCNAGPVMTKCDGISTPREIVQQTSGDTALPVVDDSCWLRGVVADADDVEYLLHAVGNEVWSSPLLPLLLIPTVAVLQCSICEHLHTSCSYRVAALDEGTYSGHIRR